VHVSAAVLPLYGYMSLSSASTFRRSGPWGGRRAIHHIPVIMYVVNHTSPAKMLSSWLGSSLTSRSQKRAHCHAEGHQRRPCPPAPPPRNERGSNRLHHCLSHPMHLPSVRIGHPVPYKPRTAHQFLSYEARAMVQVYPAGPVPYGKFTFPDGLPVVTKSPPGGSRRACQRLARMQSATRVLMSMNAQ
jgi:hypothetical protein